MRTAALALPALVLLVGCDTPMEQKIKRQKAVYFKTSEVPRREQEKEIEKYMRERGLRTPGLAMIYLLQERMRFLPMVDGMVNQAAANAGIQLPTPPPWEQYQAQEKLSKDLQALAVAQRDIALMEQESPQ